MTERPAGSGKWQLRVFVGRDPVTGRPRPATQTVDAKSRKQAQAKLNTFISECAAKSKPGTSATVEVILAEWLQHSEARGRSPKTIHEAKAAIDKVLVPELGAVPAKDLTPHHLDQLYLKLSTGQGRARPLSPASVRRYHAVMSAALTQAVKWGWLERNVAERATPPVAAPAVLRVPTTAEVKELVAAATKRGRKWGALLALALATGMRRGELCALRWTDIDGSVIRVQHSLYRAGTERGEKGTKGGRERWVTFGPVAVAFLEDWRAECERAALEAGVELVPDAFVVPALPDGSRPVNPDTLSSVVNKLCGPDHLNIPHVHLHSLRHYAATELIGSGISPRDAAEILGHADPALTLRVYTHATSAGQGHAADVLDRALVPATESTT